jgi:uncharacterized membrane protein YoaK (UPF0700 family)
MDRRDRSIATHARRAVGTLHPFWRNVRRPRPRVHRRVRRRVDVLLAVKSLLFAAAALVACLMPTGVPGPGRVAVVALLVTAMAIQNTVHRLHPTFGPMTTVMTGNVTGWLVEALGPSTPEGAPRRRLVSLVIAAFVVGCATGGFGVVRFGFVVLVVPMVATLLARARVPA